MSHRYPPASIPSIGQVPKVLIEGQNVVAEDTFPEIASERRVDPLIL
jgi:hypothetical protein